MNKTQLKVLRFAKKITNLALNPFHLEIKSNRMLSTEERMNRLTDNLPMCVFEDCPMSFYPWSDLLEKSIIWLRRLSGIYQVCLSVENADLFAKFDGIKIKLESWEEVLIAYEIFGLGEYNFFIKGENIVMDFGMNVGLASLYFSKMESVKMVYAYEPFLPTFQSALINLKLNPELALKVVPNNFGVGSDNQIIETQYDPNRKGCMGNFSINNFNTDIAYDRVERIEIRPASEQVFAVRKAHPSENIIVKIDIEGGEYDVVGNFFDSGCINEISSILMEWHYKDPSYLIEKLMQTGFAIYTQGSHSGDCGKIYAFRGICYR